jgi:hypothetical protein
MDRSAGDLARSTLGWPGRTEGFQGPGRPGSAADEVVRASNFGSVVVMPINETQVLLLVGL